MQALRNRVQLIGHLGNRPEICNMGTGKKQARFSITTNETYRNARGRKINATQSHSVIARGRVAVIAEKYLDKGMAVAIEGRLVNRHYHDRQGQKKQITEIQINELLLLGVRNGE